MAELTANIQNWDIADLNKLAEMSMDSMQELYSQFSHYDDRWNEIFIKPLTQDLLELKVG